MPTCAIMQPTYLPWSGYFNLLASVDVFVLLDDVQFERQSWQTRNRILLHGKEHLLAVPIKRMPLDTPIREIELHQGQDWRKTHLQNLSYAYAKHPHGRIVLDLVAAVFARGHVYLADLNEALIRELAALLAIDTPIQRASTLGCGGSRSDHVAAICRAVNCQSYLSPAGAHDYMAEDQFEERHGIATSYQDFRPPPYRQTGTREFVSHLSIVDVIAHLGPSATRAYISGDQS